MSHLSPNVVPAGAKALRKAFSYEKFGPRNYRQALSQANSGDKAVWERLITDTQEHVEFRGQSLQLNYGLG